MSATLDAGNTGQPAEPRGLRTAVARAALSVLAGASGFLFAHAGAASSPASGGWSGLPLSAAISRLAAGGVPVVYSSHIVRPEMTVTTEPHAVTARAMLDEILAPHGLQGREMASGRIVIVRRQSLTPESVAGAAAPRRAAPAPVALPLVQVLVTGSR